MRFVRVEQPPAVIYLNPQAIIQLYYNPPGAVQAAATLDIECGAHHLFLEGPEAERICRLLTEGGTD